MNNAFVLQDVARFAEVIADVRLPSDPVDVTRDAFAKVDGWFVIGGSRPRRVAREMTHFAWTKLAIDLRRDVDLQNVGKLFRDLANRCAMCAADIYGEAIQLVGLGREQIRTSNIFYERKIPRLLAVFVQHWRQIIQQACAKNCDHAGVRIEDGLARPVCAGVTKRDCGNAYLLSPEQHEPLLVNFRQPVNGFATHWCVLRGRKTFCDRAAIRAVHFPIAATQLLDRPHAWKDQSVLRTFSRAFAINGLRTGDDDLFDR